jgi:hypothetical protein
MVHSRVFGSILCLLADSLIEQLSVNAFKSVMDIDVLGSYNTLKATLPYLKESASKHRMDHQGEEVTRRSSTVTCHQHKELKAGGKLMYRHT